MIILLLTSLAQTVAAADPAAITDYSETEVGCLLSDQTPSCPSNQKCEPNCISCSQNKNNCNTCKQTYFLFTLPADHTELGLPTGSKVCVQCPYQTYNDDYTIYCGDCIEDGNNWDKWRKCTFDYYIRNLDKLKGAYHSITKPAEVLFYVVPINRVLNPTSTEYFQTVICDGCSKFCPSASQICFPVATEYKYDLNNLFVSCANGYAYSEAISGCDSCPSNCKSCNIFLNRQVDGQGRVTYNPKKVCLVCNDGFSLYKGPPKVPSSNPAADEISNWCEPCFNGCDLCYFGNEELDLNSEPWDTYVIVEKGKTWAEQLAALLLNHKIAQRCKKCTNPPNEPYILSLDTRSCVRCDSQCLACEYTTYDPGITDVKRKFPTRYAYPIEPAKTSLGKFAPTDSEYDAIRLQYKMRCRLCESYEYTFLATGNDCTQCTITNCKLCHKQNDPSQGGAPFSSYDNDFVPLDRESQSIENCLLCNYDPVVKKIYYLNQPADPNLAKTCVELLDATKKMTGCISYEKITSGTPATDTYHCRWCELGYSLEYDTTAAKWICVAINLKLIDPTFQKDFFCNSYVKDDVTAKVRCQECSEGYYVEMKTGHCQPCQSDGYCKSCAQYSFKSVYKPLYYKFKYDDDPVTYGPICIDCLRPDTQKLNPYSKKCEQCGDLCKTCMNNAPLGYCGECIDTAIDPDTDPDTRSVDSTGAQCLPCPENTIGCRNRIQSEITTQNEYFTSSALNLKYSRQSYKCVTGAYFDASTGRCMKCTNADFQYCRRSVTITMDAFCSTVETSAINYVQLPKFFENQTQKDATILLTQIEHNNNYNAWNRDGVTKVIINLQFQFSSVSTRNLCLFNKDTYITTNIKKQVFSIQDIELRISVKNAPPGQKMKLFLAGALYIQYFNIISIQGLDILPAKDYNYISIVDDLSIQTQTFRLVLLENKGAKLTLKDCNIMNLEANQYYKGIDKTYGTYTTPFSSQAVNLKKYSPFNTILLNVYELVLENVVFGSLNYLLAPDLPIQAFPLQLIYDSPIPYLSIRFVNVKFEDFAVEKQAIIDIKQTNMTSLPEWNSKIFVDNLQMKDVYFINDAALFSTELLEVPQGILSVDRMTVENARFNSSRGFVNFQTMQSVKISRFTLLNSFVNYTSLFYTTTLEVDQMLVRNTEFTFLGRVIETKFESPIIRLDSYDFSGLKMNLFNLEFNSVKCKTVSCLIYIQSPRNPFEKRMNVTLYGLKVENIIPTGFDEALIEAATSAAIQISKVYSLNVQNMVSLQNPDVTIFYSQETNNLYFSEITCSQIQNPAIRNNYCLFINNFYESVNVQKFVISNLNGLDNSFLAVVSWSNLVFNTSASGSDETVNINELIVSSCTIKTEALAVPSAAVIIESTQSQKVYIRNLRFSNNRHTQVLKGTLRPSNPTLVIRSVIGTLSLRDSIWRNNLVAGYGAVLYLEAGIQQIDNITMVNSNHDPLHLNPADPLYVPINGLAEGGHLLLQGYDIQLKNSVFRNSSARVGGAVYFRALKEGKGLFQNISIRYAYTPLDGSTVSRGGCIFIDSFSSELDLTIMQSQLQDCSVRADGGGIYLIASDKKQSLLISKTLIQNCYALGGSALSFVFEARTQAQQRVTLNEIQIQGNYSNALSYIAGLGVLTPIEEFLFIRRYAAVQQDYGQMVISNCYSEGLYFFSYISLNRPNFVRISSVENQHSALSYRPYIEILEPLLQPISIEAVQFRNISSLKTSVNCKAQTKTVEQKALCIVLQVRIDFPQIKINPAMMLVDQLTKFTPLTLNNLFINRVQCKECSQGLVQVMRVQNEELNQLVYLGASRCSNSETPYYGCYVISSEATNEILESDQYLNFTYQTNLSSVSIQNSTGLSARVIDKKILQEIDQTITQPKKNTSNFQYAIPNPPWKSHVVIKGMNAQEVQAVHGGALTLFGLTANITEMYCTLVNVSGEGGCIFFESIPKKNGSIVYQRLNLLNSVFFRNNASIGGAVRVRESGVSDPEKSLNTMIQNVARLFGNDVAGYPTKMGLKISESIQMQSYLDENTGWLHYPVVVKSGQVMKAFKNQDVVLVLMDENDNQMKYQFGAESSITSTQQNTVQGEPSRKFDTRSQGFNFSNLQILFDPYQNITLDISFTSPIVNIPRYSPNFPFQLLGFDVGYSLEARVRSVECERGEAYNGQLGSCTPCPTKTYVLEFKGICKEMDEASMNATGLDQISIRYGFWRPDHLNDLPEKCKNQDYNCKGGYDVGNDLCTEGNVGALCEECDIYSIYWDESYSQSAKYQCGTCQDKTTNIIMITCLSIWTMISTILSVKGNQERMELTILYDIIAMFGWSSSQRASSNVAVLMKILTNHLQILSILQGFQISIPTQAVDAVNTVSMPAKTVGNSLDCFLVQNTWGLDLIYFRLIWSLIMQVIYIFGILFLMLVAVLIGKLQFKIQYIYTMAIFLFLLLQPNYVMEFMLLISSRVISGVPYIQANVSYRYDTFKHDQWMAGFGVPGLVTWLAILPCAFLYVLYQGAAQEKLDSFIFSQSWGFFYHEYRRKRYYWEFCKIFYRSLISVLIVYFQEEIIIKGILSFLVVYLYYGLSNHFSPYNARTINDLDALSTVTLALSLIIGVFLFRTIEINFLGLTFAGYIVIGILNGIFMLIMFYILFQGYLKQFAPKLDEIRDKVVEKFPHLMMNPRLRPYLLNHTKMNVKARKLWQMLAKIVDVGIHNWKQDKSKPLQFIRTISQEKQVIEYNTQLNQALKQFYDMSSSQHIENQNGEQGLLPGEDQPSEIFNSQINQLPEEGKENYSYK